MLTGFAIYCTDAAPVGEITEEDTGSNTRHRCKKITVLPAPIETTHKDTCLHVGVTF